MRELFSRATNHADQRLADSAFRPRPVPPLHSFSFFAGGIFLKLYGAETGLGRASSKEEAVVMNAWCSGFLR